MLVGSARICRDNRNRGSVSNIVLSPQVTIDSHSLRIQNPVVGDRFYNDFFFHLTFGQFRAIKFMVHCDCSR